MRRKYSLARRSPNHGDPRHPVIHLPLSMTPCLGHEMPFLYLKTTLGSDGCAGPVRVKTKLDGICLRQSNGDFIRRRQRHGGPTSGAGRVGRRKEIEERGGRRRGRGNRCVIRLRRRVRASTNRIENDFLQYVGSGVDAEYTLERGVFCCCCTVVVVVAWAQHVCSRLLHQ